VKKVVRYYGTHRTGDLLCRSWLDGTQAFYAGRSNIGWTKAWRCPGEPIPKNIVVDLDRDAAALIALWLQIYGGDPIPARVEASPATATLAAAMVTQLRSEFKESANPCPMSNCQGDWGG